ncbi:MAG TPA: CoA transferase [Acidimicrobiales bacterium]|nr:CoA transferase [Acidimicrobiales bacterium]
MAENALLSGLLVLDLAQEPGRTGARLLGDLGATVVRLADEDGSLRGRVWDAGKASARPEELGDLLAAADVVIATPFVPGAVEVDRGQAPQAVWVDVTPFGLDGPRSGWRASDLGVMASSGNMYATGDPDRPPVRCTEPTSYAHGGPETALAALSGLASGRPQHVDLSLQETVLIANMGAVGRYARTPDRGRRAGANIGRSREIWPTADGFVSFGLRGGKARVPTLNLITKLVSEAGIEASALTERDWTAYNHNTVTDDELRAIEKPIGEYFSTRTMAELYATACETNLMLAPINSPKEILGSEQFRSRNFFGLYQEFDEFPVSFAQVRDRDGVVEPVRPRPSSVLGTIDGRYGRETSPERKSSSGVWAGTNILEFGSGAAGPIASRYFAEHGATVIKLESRSRPDFLRTYSTKGLDEADMFDALNAGKHGITVNLKDPRGVELARRLVNEWADAVTENFAPKAMKGFGLDYDSLSADKADLVMLSACLLGQTGPHRNYPGFGSQGAALSGFTFLTGWPDREPVGPFATITDSLAPRFAATALAAGLLYRRRTGRGVYIDLSQVEAASWSLSPWLLEYVVDGVIRGRDGNRSDRAVPHGAFPCEGKDRWVAIAAWDDESWARLAARIGVDDPKLATLAGRLERVEEVEAAVGQWTRTRNAIEVAEQLQSMGIEAVPVQDFADVFTDPQLAARGHFVEHDHPKMGRGSYEHSGFRFSDAPSGHKAASPILGQHNDQVFGDILGLSAAEQEALAADGVIE